jgi:hypothetical protein
MRSLLLALIAFPYMCIAQDIQVAMSNIQTVAPSQPITKPIEHEVTELETRHNNVSSILVKGKVAINTKEGKGMELNAALFTTGTQTRIRIEFAGTVITDYVLDDTKATIFLPHKNVAFLGEKTEVIKLQSWFSLLTSELCGFSMAFPEAWDTEATQRRYMKDKNTMIVFRMNGDVVQVLKKVVFAKKGSDLVVSNIYKYNKEGELSGVISFDDYKTVSDKLIPHKISFAVNEDATIVFNFQEINLNESARSEGIFQIQIPTEVKKLDVVELDKKNWL